MKLIMNDRNAKRIISKGSDVIDMRSETYKAWAYVIIIAFLEILLLLSITVYSGRNISDEFSAISTITQESTVTIDEP